MLQDEMDALRRENEEVRSRNASLESAIDEMDDMIGELRFENNTLRRKDGPSRSDGDNMLDDPMMDETYQIKAQNESLQLMVEDMESIIVKLEKKNKTLENARNESTATPTNDMDKMKELEKENKGLRFNLDNLINKTIDRHENQIALIKEYEDKLEDMETRLNNAYAQLDNCKPKMESKKVSKELKKTAKSKSAKSWLKKFFKKRT